MPSNNGTAQVEVESTKKPTYFEKTPVGLVLRGKPSYQDWETFGLSIWQDHNAIQWHMADWIRLGEYLYGEMYTQAAALTKYAVQTLMNKVFIANAFDISRRRELPYTFSHHDAVAGLPHDVQDRLLDWCRLPDGGIRGRDELREAVRLYKENLNSKDDEEDEEDDVKQLGDGEDKGGVQEPDATVMLPVRELRGIEQLAEQIADLDDAEVIRVELYFSED